MIRISLLEFRSKLLHLNQLLVTEEVRMTLAFSMELWSTDYDQLDFSMQVELQEFVS